MYYPKKVIITLSVLCFVFFLTACERLEKLDKKLGELLNSEPSASQDKAVKSGNSDEPVDPSTLSREQKEEIDRWLTGNGFNRYGDPVGTFYTGGTPLFDEKSGETRERFEYILEKHPDILNKI